MFQTSNQPAIVIFPLIMGSLAIMLALFNRQLLRLIKIKPLSEVFTTPRLQRSAKITEKLGQLFLGFFGLGFLIQGLGPRFLSSDSTYIISMAVLGLMGLIILAAVGVVLVNWKAR